jgi:error-prone DNA polymerase
METLMAEREAHGPFAGIAELASRSGASRAGLERLAWAGALDGLALGGEAEAGDGRRRSYWRLGVAAGGREIAAGTQLSLPLDPPPSPELPAMSRWETVLADYATSGMTLGDHPLGLLRGELDESVARSIDLQGFPDGGTVEVAGLVVARQRPATAKGVVFMLLEDEHGTINLVVPPPVFERFRGVVRAAPLVLAKGSLERRQGAINVVVDRIRALQRPDLPLAEVRQIEPPVGRETGREEDEEVPSLERIREARERAVAELRAVAPAAHSFGRRGR